ncbi:MAG: hypothetical protein AAFX95_27175 [Cyanobacteria bacterium J06639_16]
MRNVEASTLRDLASDIELEITKLIRLETQIERVKQAIAAEPTQADLFYESLALKFHNFYTGCEHIFCLVASELNSGVPTGADWHKRLLERMSAERDGRREVITIQSARGLQEFLGFRHVVRNLYGFELDTERVDRLLERYTAVWSQVKHDLQAFVQWLRDLASALENDAH